MFENQKIGFIGAGNMASAIVQGLIKKKMIQPTQVIISDIQIAALQNLSEKFEVETTTDNSFLISKADWIVLAVKPQVLERVLSEIGEQVRKDQSLISIAAGISISKIESSFKNASSVFRVMPNTPALIGEGISAISKGINATEKQMQTVLQLFRAVGEVVEVPESSMDAVTGLSGSGPAYVFTMIEALSDAGVRQGLSRQVALKLAAKTLQGASKMVIETGIHPAKLKDQVTSPGGTTIAGLHQLEKGNIRATLIDAVAAATARSKELGKK